MDVQTILANDNFTFMAKLDNVKNLSHILKAIHFKDLATVFVTDKGIKVTVEDSKCLQANAFIEESVFDEFEVREEATFCINLNILQECLTIFGSNPISAASLQMVYEGWLCVKCL